MAAPLLAPMVRACCPPLRALALRYGAAAAYTGAVVASNVLEADIYASAGDVLFVRKGGRVLQLLLAERDKTVVQLAGADPRVLAAAARRLAPYCAGVDLNAGCMKEWAQERFGGHLLGHQDLFVSCMEALRAATRETGLRCSCKIRLLEDVAETARLVGRLLALGVDAVAVHARRRDEERDRDAARFGDFLALERLLAPEQHRRLVYNGGILTPGDLQALRAATGAAPMLARGALRNCSLVAVAAGLRRAEAPPAEVLRAFAAEARAAGAPRAEDYALAARGTGPPAALRLRDYAFQEARCCAMFMAKELLGALAGPRRRAAAFLVRRLALARRMDDLDAAVAQFEEKWAE